MDRQLTFGKRYEYGIDYADRPLKFGYIQMYGIRELFCEAGFALPPCKLEEIELYYIVTGQATLQVDGWKGAVGSDDVVVIRPGQTVSFKANRGMPVRFCTLRFQLDVDDRAPETRELYRFYTCRQEPAVVTGKAMLPAFSGALSELHDEAEFYQVMVGGYVEQIVVGAYRLFRDDGPFKEGDRPAVTDGEGLACSVVYALAAYLDQHYRDVTDIRGVARRMGYSYTYLAHQFREKMGTTIGGYILQKKMEEAKWLLRSRRLTVSQIAERLNYQSVQAFSGSFKRQVGVSPVEYQQTAADDREGSPL